MRTKRAPHILWDIIVAAVIFLMSTYTIFNGNLYHYLLAPIAQVNPGVFSADFMVQAQEAFTPQFLTNAFYVLFLRTGLNYNTINFILYLISYTAFAGGIIAISRYSLKQYSFVMVGVVLLLSLYSRATHPIGGNLVWATMFKYDNMAMCFVPWSIYFVLQKKWWLAFVFCTLATLFHFHVGIYCAVFIVPLLIYDSFKDHDFKKIFSMIPWLAVCLGMYAVMSAQGTLDSHVISNDEYIKILVMFRGSHHLMPSSWSAVSYANFIGFVLSVGVLTSALKPHLPKETRIPSLLIYLIVLMATCLLFNFIFIEVLPLSLMAKLQPGRVIPMFSLMLYLLLGYYCGLHFDDKTRGTLLLIISLSLISVVYSGIIALTFSIIFVLYHRFFGKKKSMVSAIAIAITIISGVIMAGLINYLLKDRLEFSVFHYVYKYFYPISVMILFYLFGFLARSKQRKNRQIQVDITRFLLIPALVLLLIIMPWVNNLSLAKPYISFKTVEQRFKGNGMDKSLERLALRFKDNSDIDSVVLGNPFDDQIAGFRLYAQRSCVVTYKNVPQSDSALIEWMDRLLDLGAAYKRDSGLYGKDFDAFFTIDGSVLLDYCDKYHVTHLITNESTEAIEEKYIPLGFSTFDKEGLWVILKRQ